MPKAAGNPGSRGAKPRRGGSSNRETRRSRRARRMLIVGGPRRYSANFASSAFLVLVWVAAPTNPPGGYPPSLCELRRGYATRRVGSTGSCRETRIRRRELAAIRDSRHAPLGILRGGFPCWRFTRRRRKPAPSCGTARDDARSPRCPNVMPRCPCAPCKYGRN